MATINGTSPAFKIKIVREGKASVTHTFSHRYKELRFHSEDFYKTPEGGRARSGKALQKFKWIINYYEIDFTEFIADEDAYKVQDVLNAEAEGAELIITPCLEILQRYEKIVQLKQGGSAGKKQLTQRFRAKWNRGSKGLLLTYVSAEAQRNFNWQNPADVTQVYLRKLARI